MRQVCLAGSKGESRGVGHYDGEGDKSRRIAAAQVIV